MTDQPETEYEDLASLKHRVYSRLRLQGLWNVAEPIRDQLIISSKSSGMSKAEAQRTAYQELDRRFPTTTPEPADTQGWNTSGNGEGDAALCIDAVTEEGSRSVRAREDDGSQVLGLGDLPESWPRLPANAPLAAEIQWCQANRLQCVTETGDRCLVDLSRSLTPAPSYAALGWLETSIRAYTKFVDVAAKATASLEDEKEHIRRERMAIDDVRKLLAEMQTEG